MEERNDKTWCEALHTYNAFDIGAVLGDVLTSTTTFGTGLFEQLTYAGKDVNDGILEICDRGYEFSIFDPYERIKELERENEMLKNMLKECEI